ncbi:hypothetical protein F2Q70_00032264 [Brassica cretica]|uniref:Uncharacterized protein n=1 Tax=Brassica cretica TaxID=69181 RepID=A0A8S9FJE1_BRACR|nr:hypothetical protein F2Q70_00032264 [Brassica cretica]
MVVQIADGNDTRVWEDHWLHVLPPGKLQSPCLLPNMKVSEFIDQETRTWNVTRIRDYVAPEEVLPPGKLQSPCMLPNMKVSEFIDQETRTWNVTKIRDYVAPEEVWILLLVCACLDIVSAISMCGPTLQT